MRFQTLALFLWAAAAASAGVATPRLSDLPAWFEPAAGRAGRFVARGGSVNLEVDAGGATLVPSLRMTIAGGRAARLEGVERRRSMTNYFIGNRRSEWRQGVAQFDRVRASGVYPGIDLVYYSSGKQLEYDFVVAPGADPAAIGMKFSRRPALNGAGELVFPGAGGVRQLPPLAYQERSGRRVAVDARYELAGGTVRFRVGAYDRALPLVIDPVLAYGAFLGGSVNDAVRAIVASRDGGYWITGAADSTIYGMDGIDGYSPDKKSGRDVFLAKLVPASGSWTIVEWTYIGGGGDDDPAAIALHPGGGAVLTGSTASTDFPYAGSAAATTNAGSTDAFVVWYEPQWQGAAKLVYSTYFGGAATDTGAAVAVDARGRIVIAGTTASTGLAGVSDQSVLNQLRGPSDAFVAVFEPLAGSSTLTYSSYLGSPQADTGTGVAWASDGTIWLCGSTFGDDFPVTDKAYRNYYLGQGDAFIARIDPGQVHLDGLIYGSYLGGSDLDIANGMSVDASGRLWLTGYTFSSDLPVTPGAYQSAPSGGGDAFVLAVDPSATGPSLISYCSYLGGSGGDVGYAVVPWGDGKVTVAGYTYSRDFPSKGVTGFTPPPAHQSEAFVTTLDTAQAGTAALAWSGVFGGNNMDVAAGLAFGKDGNPMVVGYTGSADFPAASGDPKQSPANAFTGFLLLLTLNP